MANVNLYTIHYMRNAFMAARFFDSGRISRGILIGLVMHQKK